MRWKKKAAFIEKETEGGTHSGGENQSSALDMPSLRSP